MPGPGAYNNMDTALKLRDASPRLAMPKASRDYSFSKYNSLHSVLVSKGLY
jgi:hypothetical protein